MENKYKHLSSEERDKIITVRFTYRDGQVRIFGAGYWRKGKMYYEEK